MKSDFESIEAAAGNPDVVPGTTRFKVGCSPHLSPFEQSESYLSAPDKNLLHGQLDPHYELKKENFRHKLVIYLVAQGYTDREVAAQTEYTTIAVSNIRRQPWAVKQIEEIQRKAGVDEVAKIFQGAKMKAAKALEKVLDAQDEVGENGLPVVSATAVIAASNSILDRVYGKAKSPMDCDGLSKLDLSKSSDEELMAILIGGNTRTA